MFTYGELTLHFFKLGCAFMTAIMAMLMCVWASYRLFVLAKQCLEKE